MVLLLNRTRLPFDAIFLLRFQSFASAIHYGAYEELYSARDKANLPLLRQFAAVLQRVWDGIEPPCTAPSTESVIAQCDAAVARYFVSPQLKW
jgi:hypothetical protein